MESFEDFRRSGTFTVAAGTEVQGDLILKGSKTTLDLFSKDFFSTHDIQDGCILGVLHDRTKVSLIKCITTQGPGSGSRGGEHYHFSRVFPHFVLFGDEHITTTDKKIANLSFHVDDAATLFYDFDAFGDVIDAGPHMARILDEESRRYGRDVTVGDHPMLFYFTGKYEIFKAETVLGTVTAEHRPSFTVPGPDGIKLDNKIFVNIAFKEKATIDEAITAVYTLLRFLEIIAGRPQVVLRLAFVIPGPEDSPRILNVYGSMLPSHDSDDTERTPHPADLPIQAAHTPEYFASVLTTWLARDHEWRSARSRFSTAFSLQRRFNIDRLVGTANMFDILPALAVPADVPLAEELKEAKRVCREVFEALPSSPERDSVLNALDRLGRASLKHKALKHKIRARAKLILSRIPARFPELGLVIDEAVNCRNHFVHGSKAKMDYTVEFDQVIFFTEALEFIFAASDLIECGWDIEQWSKQDSAMSHPFDRFRLDYELRLKDLKRALVVAIPSEAPPTVP
jgi:hypothetical protein